jgi:hypothetical protein
VIERGRGGVGDLLGLTPFGIRGECLDPADRLRAQACDAGWDLKLLGMAVRVSPPKQRVARA